MHTQQIKKLIVFGILGVTFIGQGIMNSAMSNTAQGRIMARRAAFVDVYRQAGGSQGLQIVNEVFDGQVYKVTAVRRN